MAVDTAQAQLGELVRRYFALQDERPGGVEEVDIGSLDPFLRSLVFTDGTVTRALAVQALAPVAVSRLSQEEVPLPAEAAAYLDVESGAPSIRRRVEIRSGSTPLLWAESYLLPERLPAGFFGRLEDAADGIGQSLGSMESFRELLWFGLDALPEWAPEPGEKGEHPAPLPPDQRAPCRDLDLRELPRRAAVGCLLAYRFRSIEAGGRSTEGGSR